jgi:hypothetical protein
VKISVNYALPKPPVCTLLSSISYKSDTHVVFIVSPVAGRANQLEILVQGKQGKTVMEYLLEKGVPKKWIEIDDTTEKKKPK